MKISNFEMVDIINKGDVLEEIRVARVDVETGCLWWKNKERVTVQKKYANEYWFFVENGEFTPDRKVEALERSWYARRVSEKSKILKEGVKVALGEGK